MKKNKQQWAAALDDVDKISYNILEGVFSNKISEVLNGMEGQYRVSYKTTEDIRQDIEDMVEVEKDFVNLYMNMSGYKPVNHNGKIAWKIYEFV